MISRRVRHLGLPMLALAIALAGCAAEPASEEGDNQGAAISKEEAAADRGLKELVISEVPASAKNVESLGIKKWSVYAQDTGGFTGMVAFATDAAGDVKYALVVDGKGGQAAIVAYSKTGILPGAPMSQAVREALFVDFAMLQAKLHSMTLTSCGLRIAAASLAVVVVVGAAWFAGSVAALVGVFATTGWVGSAVAALGATGSAEIGGAVVVAAALTSKGREEIGKTITVCKVAVQGT